MVRHGNDPRERLRSLVPVFDAVRRRYVVPGLSDHVVPMMMVVLVIRTSVVVVLLLRHLPLRVLLILHSSVLEPDLHLRNETLRSTCQHLIG